MTNEVASLNKKEKAIKFDQILKILKDRRSSERMTMAKKEWIQIEMARKNQSKAEVYTLSNVDQILPIEVIKRRRELEL